ncbi:MAG: tetratricopeptide repeat protein [Alphaproteobacteria bacterium]
MARKPEKNTKEEAPQLTASFVEEVEEELRQEKLHKAWRRYGPVAAILAVSIVAGVFGWSTYTALKEKKAQAQSQQYSLALSQIEAQQQQEAQKTLQNLSEEGEKGYQFASKMQLAAIELSKGNKDTAINQYQSIIDANLESPYQNLALISIARLLIGDEKINQYLPQIENLANSNYQMRWLAQEVKALNFMELGKKEDAKNIFNLIIEAANVPSDIQQRASLMLEMIEE